MKFQINYELATHRGQDIIFIRFISNPELNLRVRKLVGVKWSQTHKSWYVMDNAQYREKFGLQSKPILNKDSLAGLHEINQSAMLKYVETLQLKAYSLSTINTYRNEFGQLLHTLKDNKVDDLDAERLRSYFLYCINVLKLSENTLHSRINAVKFYFEQILKREKFFMEIPRPKKPSILPKVIDVKDIKKLFAVTTNLKHCVMLKLCYGMGLRVSEITNLKITDIDSQRMQVLAKV